MLNAIVQCAQCAMLSAIPLCLCCAVALILCIRCSFERVERVWCDLQGQRLVCVCVAVQYKIARFSLCSLRDAAMPMPHSSSSHSRAGHQRLDHSFENRAVGRTALSSLRQFPTALVARTEQQKPLSRHNGDLCCKYSLIS